LYPQHSVIRRLVGRPAKISAGHRGLWLSILRLCPFGVGLAFLSAFGAEPPAFFFIAEYRVHGVHSLAADDVEQAVYPFVGPDRTLDDIQAACTSLEKAYQAKGFGAATVRATGRATRTGIVELVVSEGRVEKLRVKGAHYFSPVSIKTQAPALAEGRVLNFNDINHDVVALNQLQDRTVTPTLRPGAEPGTYDIDLDVKDSPPLHAGVELNDYSSPNTRPLRLTGSVNDSNLWQTGQGAGVSFEEAPQRREDSEVFSGYYLARFAGLERFSLMVQGTKQDSNVSTLGGSTVAGPGQTLELRAIYALPNGKDWSTLKDWQDFSQSVSLSLDYKHFSQSVQLAPPSATAASASTETDTIVTPITYYPLTAGYSATWGNASGKGSVTGVDAAVTLNFRGAGSGPNQFNLNRYGADGSFIYFRGDVSRAQALPAGWVLFGKIQGQVASEPLISSEEYSGGGEQTVRGYLESEVVGDDGVFGSLELRTPSLLVQGKQQADCRLYLFADGGALKLIDPLPEQTANYSLSSVGIGTRLSLFDHLSGACDVGYPLISQAYTMAHEVQVRFRLRVDY
jgi:hemolysin activation/secretion protein